MVRRRRVMRAGSLVKDSPETEYAKQRAIRWMLAAIDREVVMGLEFFGFLNWISEDLEPLLNAVSRESARLRSNAGKAAHEAVKQSLGASKRRYYHECDDLVDEHPCLMSIFSDQVSAMLKEAQKDIPRTEIFSHAQIRACLETSAFIVTRRHVDKKRLCAAAKTREDCQTVPQRSDGQRMGACTSSPAPCFWRRSEAQNRPA